MEQSIEELNAIIFTFGQGEHFFELVNGTSTNCESDVGRANFIASEMPFSCPRNNCIKGIAGLAAIPSNAAANSSKGSTLGVISAIYQ